MARPKAKELTQRELEVMHVCWELGPATVAQIRKTLQQRGRSLAYTTVATLVRILTDKEFLEQRGEERPFSYAPLRSFRDVSDSLVGDLVQRVFGGSREQLLLSLLDQKKLSDEERAVLEQILEEEAR